MFLRRLRAHGKTLFLPFCSSPLLSGQNIISMKSFLHTHIVRKFFFSSVPRSRDFPNSFPFVLGVKLRDSIFVPFLTSSCFLGDGRLDFVSLLLPPLSLDLANAVFWTFSGRERGFLDIFWPSYHTHIYGIFPLHLTHTTNISNHIQQSIQHTTLNQYLSPLLFYPLIRRARFVT